MSPRALSNRRIHEVQQALSTYAPAVPATDLDLLASLCKAVIGSIDVRDLRDTSTRDLITQLEQVLHTIEERETGAIALAVRRHGESMVIETCVDDQPFLVSALRALCAQEQIEVRTSINAIARLKRDRTGKLVSFGSGTSESIIRMDTRAPESLTADDLDQKVRRRLALAQAMVNDFQSMKRHMMSAADELLGASPRVSGDRSELMRETESLLRWLCEENFVMFSVEEYDRTGERKLVRGASSVVPALRSEVLIKRAADGTEGRFIRYQRSAEESPVHRAGKPGHFLITRVDRTGEPVGTIVIDGLFTYKALHTPPEEIPHLRVMLRDLLVDRDVGMDSHRGKNITNAFNSLPIEYLLTESRQHIWDLTDRVLRAEEERGSDVELRLSEDRRSAFLFVTLPREQFSENLRLELQNLLLQRLGASYADYGVYIDRYENAIVHFYVTSASPLPEVDLESLRSDVHALAKGWQERLQEALERLGFEGDRLSEAQSIYLDAFNEEHRRRVDADRLAGDIRCLESIQSGRTLECDLFVSTTGDHPGSLNLRVFTAEPIQLSDELPVIVNFGFDVVDSYTREVRLHRSQVIEMHNFRLNVRRDLHRKVLGRREEITRALRRVFDGRLGDDELNRLVAFTNLNGRDVEILRAYVAYVHQLGTPFTTELIRQVLVSHPTVAQSFMALLSARFDPAADAAEVPVAAQTLDGELRAVTDYTADRVLQALAEVVRCTERTNAFKVDISVGEALAIKIDAAALSYGPTPKPYREIWVYHPELEGVHLRGGKVARGGLRFSDRPDDFRTEIHGLMTTQMVKNVLIVPMGAKGGFVLRHPPAGRAELRAAGDRYYQVFISALLSITDNVVDGEVMTPEGIRHTEGEDPYLVVAADKGTAHLSDTANAISMERRFWLDDAFASGGSNGYDHKATGITARGAWEATKRNFRELGIDPETDVITAIGVGDMSGDVFGNGLLRSRSTKLQAAFNHMHIFVDPHPDPEVSYAERQRLFDLAGSTWADYDKFSPGGGVFDRKTKEVALSSEARSMLGLRNDEVVSGDQVIRAIMKMSVDLVWMGGIGTYVKAAGESHADVGDKSNDAVRVDARDMRCRVFAEGANLAITDRGRVELSQAGASVYTAFLDNSGGVDTSDHEVNIKILFSPLLAAGTVDREARNDLLREVEAEVCEMVLENVRSQSRMVSYDVRRSASDLWRYSRTCDRLATEVPFEPEAFAMPSEDELAARQRRGEGYLKCEAAVLGSHAKMLAYRRLLEGDALPQALEAQLVRDYFPQRVREVAGDDALQGHLLRREIATTMLVNKVVDNSGASFLGEVSASTGQAERDVAVAYMTAGLYGNVDAARRALYGAEDKHNQGAVYAAMEVLQSALERATYQLLDLGVAAGAPARVEAGRQLVGQLESLLDDQERETMRARAKELELTGIDGALCLKIESLGYLPEVIEALEMGEELGRDPAEMLRIRLDVASRLGLLALRSSVSGLGRNSPYEGPAVAALFRQLDFHVGKMARLVAEADGDVDAVWNRWVLTPVSQRVTEIRERGEVGIAGIVLLDSHLRRLLPPKRSSS